MDNQILCPFCESDDYDIYDSITFHPQNIDFCVCNECGGQFKAIYNFSHVLKDE